MSISEKIKQIKDALPANVKLVAVSKTKPVEDIQEAYDCGQRIFGENKAQELTAKYEALPKDIEWHMIGHLQTNKVKYIAPFVAVIHAVDSLDLLKHINKEAAKHQRNISCLLQFHIASEETKFGMDINEARSLLTDEAFLSMQNITISGVMGMASNTDDINLVHQEFHHLKEIFDTLRSEFFPDSESFKELSMGMSGDYQIAIEEGSTMVRIGSSIFGARNYAVTA